VLQNGISSGYDIGTAVVRRILLGPGGAFSELTYIAANDDLLTPFMGGPLASPNYVFLVSLDQSLHAVTGFGANGYSYLQFGAATSDSNGIALDSMNRVIVSGTAHAGNDSSMGVGRVLSTGSFDSTFGTGGALTFNFSTASSGPTQAKAAGLLVQRDDATVIGGSYTVSGGVIFALVRVRASGAPDLRDFGRVGGVDGAHTYLIPAALDGAGGGGALVFTAGEKILLAGSDTPILESHAFTAAMRMLNDRIFTEEFEAPVFLPRVP
jgi:hypothetical protein